ncbi:dysbindin domain-containing protein 1 isoform X1 [Corvus hawaiiensis]|uniref:dysbindin domain-containing protein 1 isoform X1 n=1 Tax=Corvus hawaiiensis TaxID=134902 RepID=UPI00201952C5|nr:dysbindin domain-containing protein 1 isoform X1 [Corvus hawaiiensis]
MAKTICRGRLVPPALPGDSPSTIRPFPGPGTGCALSRRHKGAARGGGRGAGGGGCQLPTRGSRQFCPSPRSSQGSCCPRPLSRAPCECWGAPGGTAFTDAEGADVAELGKEPLVPEHPAGTPTHGPAQETPRVPAEEQGGIPIPSAGLLQVTERRQPLSSVSSLEVHFDLLDLTELTDMSDQELAEVFADSDEENVAGETPGGLQPPAVPRAGYLRSPSWTRAREQGRDKKHLSDPELPPGPPGPPDAFLPAERPREP